MISSCDNRFEQATKALGFSFEGPLQIGGNYVPVIQHGNQLFVSGQIPRVGDRVVITGSAGDGVDLSQAQMAAKICAMRALALLQRTLGSLDKVQAILKINVYIQSSRAFTQQSEVADGASEILYAVLGPMGSHTRTSVGVYQLPKNATVELDLIATCQEKG